MTKQERVHQIVEELRKTLDEITLENIVLTNFVEENGLLPEYEAFKQEIKPVPSGEKRLVESKNISNENRKQEQKEGEKKTYRDRKPVQVRLP